jgi:hypothetical protein
VTARVRGDVEMWHVVCRVIATNGDAEWRVTRVAHSLTLTHLNTNTTSSIAVPPLPQGALPLVYTQAPCGGAQQAQRPALPPRAGGGGRAGGPEPPTLTAFRPLVPSSLTLPFLLRSLFPPFHNYSPLTALLFV